jgi:hypothetical protein
MGRRQWDKFDQEAENEADNIGRANHINKPRLRKHRQETMYDYGTLCSRPIRTGQAHRKIG